MVGFAAGLAALVSTALGAGPATALPTPAETFGPMVTSAWANYTDVPPATVKVGSTYYAIISQGGGTWQRYTGSSIDGLAFSNNADYSSFPRPHSDDAYWMSDIWVNPSDGYWYGVVHAEYNYNSSGHTRRILLAKSTDQGSTWSDQGDIVTPDSSFSPPVSGASDYGDGDQRLVIDTSGGYFYVFYWAGYYTSSALTVRINVARCPISSGMAPGCWTKWNSGSFSQSGLGGHDGQIMSFTGQFVPTTPTGEFNYNDVPLFTYDSYLGEFIAMGHDWMSTATNLGTESWTNPVELTGGTSTDHCWYMWALDSSTGSKYSVGQSFRYYGTGTGCNFQGQYQTVTLGADPTSVNTWYASNGFTQNPWRYEYTTTGSTFSPMSYNVGSAQWVGSEPYCTVFASNQQHPGSAGCRSARTWQAPYAANVTIGASGSISVAAGCSGNTAGVNLQIMKNGTQIWPSSGSQNIPNGNSYTFPSGVTTNVAAGDKLEFVDANSGSVNYCDATTWNQTVTVTGTSTGWTASNGFTQAWDQWRYEYTTNNGASYSPMSYDQAGGKWTGSEAYCTIFSPHEQHPGSAGCQSARTWQAPYAGTATIGSNGSIQVAPGCSGNTAGVNIRIFKNGTQIWPSSGSQNITNGSSYTFPTGVTTSVAAGDKLEFVDSNAGSVNYCDGTAWDPQVTVS